VGKKRYPLYTIIYRMEKPAEEGKL